MHKKVKSIKPESRAAKNSKETVKPIPELPRIVHIFAFDGDYPRQVIRLDLAYRIDRLILEYLWDRYSVCQFKNTTAYNKGRRLVGQHNKGVTVQIGRFSGPGRAPGVSTVTASRIDPQTYSS